MAEYKYFDSQDFHFLMISIMHYRKKILKVFELRYRPSNVFRPFVFRIGRSLYNSKLNSPFAPFIYGFCQSSPMSSQ